MKGLETGRDKIQKICDVLKNETLEPAKQEAREIIENAHLQAEEILRETREKADTLIQSAKDDIEEKRKVFSASLQLACRQGVELLKQKIENELFDKSLGELVSKEMKDPKVIAQLINSFMKSVEEQGLEEEFVASIPKDISPKSINALIAENSLEKLQKQSVEIGDFAGGVKIQMKGRQITIDISDTTVKELIAGFIRRDFRDMIFSV